MKSCFHYIFFVNPHLHNKIMISLYIFFTNPITLQNYTFAILMGCEKMYNGLHSIFYIFIRATKLYFHYELGERMFGNFKK